MKVIAKALTSAFGCAILLAHIGQAAAQSSPELANKQFVAAQTNTAPRIDGDLSDPAWANATRIDDMVQSRPIEYRAPSERTDIYVMYDENALYVGFHVYDSQPENITANVLQQGANTRDDDKVGLVIDPFNNQRGGYKFELNAHAVRSEAVYISGTQESFDWEGIWNAGTRMVENGWTAEFAIPFKSLSFDPGNGTWGVNFTRDLQRNQESIAWYSRNGEANPANAGKMTGIQNATQGIGLDVVPALSGSYFQNEPTGLSDSEIQPSVDMFYKITPQITLAVTLNTDFSATEADENTLNNSRFRRYFQEKRAFFLNDFDAFNFGLADQRLNGAASGNNALAFYSRRIGLDENGAPVDIVGGLKLSGRAGATEFGALVMRQDEATVITGGGTQQIAATNAIVARVSQSVFNESKIGLIFTDGNPAENQSNSLYGADFHYRNSEFYAGKSLDAVLVYQQSNDPDFNEGQSSYSATVSLDSQQGWFGGAQYFVVEENYSPGLGFTQRLNAELLSANLAHKWLFEDSMLEFVQVNLNVRRWQDLDTGNLDSSEIGIRLVDVHLRSGHVFHLDIDQAKEVVDPNGRNPTGDLGFVIPAGTYTDTNYQFQYRTPSYWDVSADIEVSRGDFYTGSYSSFEPSFDWQANRNINLSLGYDLTNYRLNGESVHTRELEFDMEVAFNSKLSLTTNIEYDNVRRQASFNNRLRWAMQPGQDLWLVFNQGLVDESDDYRFVVQDTNAAFKLRYTQRF